MGNATRRALGLLRYHETAVAVPNRGHWLCGGSFLAHNLVARLRRLGMVTGTATEVYLTERGRLLAMGVDFDPRLEVGYVPPTADEDDAADAPDYRDALDRPVPLDRAFEEDDR